MPDGVEIPAPVNTTARSALRINTAASSIAALEASAGLAVWSSGKRLSFGDEVHKFCDLPRVRLSGWHQDCGRLYTGGLHK